MVMNMRRRGRSLAVAAIAGGLALAAAHAYAQQRADHWGGRPGDEHADGGPAAHFARMCDTTEARQAGMLAFAEVRLGITDAERPAWTKFAATVKASSAPVKQVCASIVGQPEAKTLPDHLHRMELIETARLEQLRQLTPAVEEIYGVLTPQQREMADHLVGDMMHGGPGEGMHHPPTHDAARGVTHPGPNAPN